MSAKGVVTATAMGAREAAAEGAGGAEGAAAVGAGGASSAANESTKTISGRRIRNKEDVSVRGGILSHCEGSGGLCLLATKPTNCEG